jgi:hypothetical protein
VRYSIGPAFTANRLVLLDALGFSAEIPQGTTVAEVVVTGVGGNAVSGVRGSAVSGVRGNAVSGVRGNAVTGARGNVLTFPLRAGIETAEAAYDRADLRGHIRHRAAATASSDGTYRRYFTNLHLPPGFRPASIEVRRTYRDKQNGAFSLYALSLIDDRSGRALALGPLSYLASDPAHWRETTLAGVPFYEDLRALPRVWIPREARAADAASALAVMHATLGDRPTYDARQLVFVDDPAVSVRDAKGNVGIEREDDTTVSLRADCATACMVADADLFYPGWEARVDDRPARVLRVDLALRGVLLAPGRHRIELRYAPLSAGVGFGITLLAAAVLALYLWRESYSLSGSHTSPRASSRASKR